MIDHLDYSADVVNYCTETGVCDLDGDGMDCRDGDTNDSNMDNVAYLCPECEAEIDLHDLNAEEEEVNPNQPPPEPPPQDTEPGPTGDLYESSKRTIGAGEFTCAKCKTTRQLDRDETESAYCWKCSKVYTLTAKNSTLY